MVEEIKTLNALLKEPQKYGSDYQENIGKGETNLPNQFKELFKKKIPAVAKYLLLYDGMGYISLRKIKGEGPKIYNSSDMAKMGYAPKEKDYSYLVFSHEKADEFSIYSWDKSVIDKLRAEKKSPKSDIHKPIVVPLKEVMKLARKIEL